MKLNVIIVSTRPGRIGKAIGDWFFDYARENPSGFDEVILTDLAELNLPVFDEPNHPAKQDYQHDHTKKWAAIVDGSDAFVFVLPEYNFTAPPSYFNALDYLVKEWGYKPAGFVSYGGISGGLRATQSAKPILTTLKVMPLTEQVMMPMVFEHLKDGKLQPTKPMIESADAMLPELSRWAGALKTLR
ncbi:NADPH-dependent FMN reductase [Paracoccus fistulariae]|uniref:NAD(P)H-dependent oxidoreductase n=1 Tax=Paracoccus fistulariae TaxID=658446 RepID=A0ABY7SFJ1_9RHOB|nr:NAD(P)H-dependent oxidoreductase [Paracoccus fistulariae]MDB6181925.1 NAD(P)H-dependent oxidoreductase [Paracoccus fistulariae]WCR05792.1 NAD(P)H-dependent oxidoreductase [Paracoccus fistulariae]